MNPFEIFLPLWNPRLAAMEGGLHQLAVLTGSYDSGFAMDLMIKDLRIARSLARAEGLQTPVTDAAAETADSARAALARDDLDHTEVARYYESVNGVSLRATRA